jgi:hypothetical protein
VHNTLWQCVILRRSGYVKLRHALQYCIKMGYPADFFYGVVTHDNAGTIYSTTRNLAGQAGGLVSGIQGGPQGGYYRRRLFHIEFQCYRNRMEFLIVSVIRRARNCAQKLCRVSL